MNGTSYWKGRKLRFQRYKEAENKQKLVDLQAKHTLVLNEKKLFENQVKTKVEELKTEMTNMRY